ncbi:MAG TPA: hypothetical protein VK205_07605 [Prolixibacteraceae bacterium]|nr:hypothetical protein [Prolixibacteraceae bacterium]
MDDNLQPYEDQIIATDSDLKIYSKKAIILFSLIFSTIFGAVLLMQNLKDIGKKREANQVLFLSIIYTALSIFIINLPERPNFFLTYLCNFVGAMILIEFIYKRYFPDEETFEKKKIWKPLIISILIIIPFALAQIFTM